MPKISKEQMAEIDKLVDTTRKIITEAFNGDFLVEVVCVAAVIDRKPNQKPDEDIGCAIFTTCPQEPTTAVLDLARFTVEHRWDAANARKPEPSEPPQKFRVKEPRGEH